MKFSTQTHQHYCGIALHARSLYVRIMDRDGTILTHKNINAGPEGHYWRSLHRTATI